MALASSSFARQTPSYEVPLVRSLRLLIVNSPMTYQQIAAKADLSVQTVSRIASRDTISPHLRTSMRIARVFGKTLQLVDL